MPSFSDHEKVLESAKAALAAAQAQVKADQDEIDQRVEQELAKRLADTASDLGKMNSDLDARLVQFRADLVKLAAAEKIVSDREAAQTVRAAELDKQAEANALENARLMNVAAKLGEAVKAAGG